MSEEFRVTLDNMPVAHIGDAWWDCRDDPPSRLPKSYFTDALELVEVRTRELAEARAVAIEHAARVCELRARSLAEDSKDYHAAGEAEKCAVAIRWLTTQPDRFSAALKQVRAAETDLAAVEAVERHRGAGKHVSYETGQQRWEALACDGGMWNVAATGDTLVALGHALLAQEAQREPKS